MFPEKWQQISKQYLKAFSLSELEMLSNTSFIPQDLSSIPQISLGYSATSLFRDVYRNQCSFQKLPEAPTQFYVQTDISSEENDRSLIFFKRLISHPDWYVVDIFLKDRYIATFLALDIEPPKTLWDTNAKSYTPICHLLTKRPSLTEDEAYESFKFALFILLFALTYCQER